MITFTKSNSLYQVKTTIVLTDAYLRATRVIYGTLRTITTGPCITTSEFAVRANNMCSLSNSDFELLEDCDEIID